ncbi:MAG: Spy/CpxP family protein refolding chaperone [Candidatus Gastranaerophilales bacterium]|nr:Spy/CpxP family protein refolding chaperone [Candidatus Gastranaerophilales bacterium]
MKKTLLAAAILVMSTTMAYAGPQGEPPMGPPPAGHGDRPPCCEKPGCKPPAPKVDMEKKLKLTPDQIAKAKALRMDSREQMRPIMDAIKTKTEQKEIIKHNQSLTAEAQCEQVEILNNQINELKKQAHEIRIKNERDFEALLTAKQKKELDKIKANAKKDMVKQHKDKCKSKSHKNCPPKCPPKEPPVGPME